MGTRKRDAQRRQVSLSVEALEDRFLLSDAASVSISTFNNAPTVHVAPKLLDTAGTEIRSSVPQGVPRLYPAWQSTISPLHPMMSYQRDDDGDNDSPEIAEARNSDNTFLGYPLFCVPGNHAAGCLDLALPTRSPEQITAPAISLISFLPLLSASGMGVTSIGSPLATSSATAVAETAPGNNHPAPNKDGMPPLPAVPEAPRSVVPPLAQQPAEPSPLSPAGPFAELLLIDGEAIEHGLDTFFQQLSSLSEEWRDGQGFEKLALWLLAASMAGYGWIRLRDRRDNRIADLLGCNSHGTVPTNILPGGEG